MKRFILYLFLCCFAQNIFSLGGKEPIKDLIEDFLSDDWPTAMAAKEKIESLGSEAIPEMIAIMNDCRVNNLRNTGDLIFPGAEKFFGHGQIIDYDIDDLCVRAGWLLEELTFKDFGFSGIHLPADELSGYLRVTFPGYYSIEANQQQADELTESGKRKLIRTLSIEQAKEWWQTASKPWNRLEALEQALNSKNEKCQVEALFYLRNGKTRCKGLNERFYKERLEKIVTRLSKAETNRISENAKLIMLDSDFDWLTIKPVN